MRQKERERLKKEIERKKGKEEERKEKKERKKKGNKRKEEKKIEKKKKVKRKRKKKKIEKKKERNKEKDVSLIEMLTHEKYDGNDCLYQTQNNPISSLKILFSNSQRLYKLPVISESYLFYNMK